VWSTNRCYCRLTVVGRSQTFSFRQPSTRLVDDSIVTLELLVPFNTAIATTGISQHRMLMGWLFQTSFGRPAPFCCISIQYSVGRVDRRWWRSSPPNLLTLTRILALTLTLTLSSPPNPPSPNPKVKSLGGELLHKSRVGL